MNNNLDTKISDFAPQMTFGDFKKKLKEKKTPPMDKAPALIKQPYGQTKKLKPSQLPSTLLDNL